MSSCACSFEYPIATSSPACTRCKHGALPFKDGERISNQIWSLLPLSRSKVEPTKNVLKDIRNLTTVLLSHLNLTCCNASVQSHLRVAGEAIHRSRSDLDPQV